MELALHKHPRVDRTKLHFNVGSHLPAKIREIGRQSPRFEDLSSVHERIVEMGKDRIIREAQKAANKQIRQIRHIGLTP